MKSCEQILLYAQGELNPAEERQFRAHLDTCPACQAEWKFLQKLNEGLTAPSAPQQVVDKLFARTTRKKSLWARFKLVWTATAVGVVCGGIFLAMLAPARHTFDAQELVAYMNVNAEDEYSAFAQELTDMEDYF